MSNELSDFLDGGVILSNLAGSSRKQVLCSLAEAMADTYDLDQRTVFDAIQKRERLGSTAVGNGVVVPHAKVDGLTQIVGGFARLESPIDFDAIDGEPCDLVFMLLAPDDSSAEHLRALARVARAFGQKTFRDDLRNARSLEEATALLMTPAQSNAA